MNEKLKKGFEYTVSLIQNFWLHLKTFPRVGLVWFFPKWFIAFTIIWAYCAVHDLNIFHPTIFMKITLDGLLLFFGMSILTSVLFEIFIDRRLRSKINNIGYIASFTSIGIIVGIFLVINLHFNIKDGKPLTDYWEIHNIYFTFAVLLTILIKTRYIVLRQKLYGHA